MRVLFEDHVDTPSSTLVRSALAPSAVYFVDGISNVINTVHKLCSDTEEPIVAVLDLVPCIEFYLVPLVHSFYTGYSPFDRLSDITLASVVSIEKQYKQLLNGVLGASARCLVNKTSVSGANLGLWYKQDCPCMVCHELMFGKFNCRLFSYNNSPLNLNTKSSKLLSLLPMLINSKSNSAFSYLERTLSIQTKLYMDLCDTLGISALGVSDALENIQELCVSQRSRGII